ncbi:MAG: SDR family oxidoreductase [Saprospiraceae bacterium]|nr:SDR family oxidoreductase [Saprospiraceae bacterium]
MLIVITGGTKGIGRATAIKFAQNKYDIALCSRNADDASTFAAELAALYSVKTLGMGADLSIKSDILAFGNAVLQKWENVDILVNNAGIFLAGPIFEEPDGHLEKMMETNLYSAYHLTRLLIGSLKNTGNGQIFNMCSIASFMAYPNGGSYSITKFALLGFSKVLRAELMGQNVKVTAVMPGATWSASWDGAPFPEERLMRAEEIASILFDTAQLHPTAVVEEIIIRPLLGDL